MIPSEILYPAGTTSGIDEKIGLIFVPLNIVRKNCSLS